MFSFICKISKRTIHLYNTDFIIMSLFYAIYKYYLVVRVSLLCVFGPYTWVQGILSHMVMKEGYWDCNSINPQLIVLRQGPLVSWKLAVLARLVWQRFPNLYLPLTSDSEITDMVPDVLHRCYVFKLRFYCILWTDSYTLGNLSSLGISIALIVLYCKLPKSKIFIWLFLHNIFWLFLLFLQLLPEFSPPLCPLSFTFF